MKLPLNESYYSKKIIRNWMLRGLTPLRKGCSAVQVSHVSADAASVLITGMVDIPKKIRSLQKTTGGTSNYKKRRLPKIIVTGNKFQLIQVSRTGCASATTLSFAYHVYVPNEVSQSRSVPDLP